MNYLTTTPKCTDIYYCPNGDITCPSTNCDSCYCPPAQLTLGTSYTLHSPTMYTDKNYNKLDGGWVVTSDGTTFSPDNSGFGKPPSGVTFYLKSATSSTKDGDPIKSGDQVYMYYGKTERPFRLDKKSSHDYEMNLTTGTQEILEIVGVNPPFGKYGNAKSEKSIGTPILLGDPFYLKWPTQNALGFFYNGTFHFYTSGGGGGNGLIPIVFAAYDKKGLPGGAEKIKRCLKDEDCSTGYQCKDKKCVKKPKKTSVYIIVLVVIVIIAIIVGIAIYMHHKKKTQVHQISPIEMILRS